MNILKFIAASIIEIWDLVLAFTIMWLIIGILLLVNNSIQFIDFVRVTRLVVIVGSALVVRLLEFLDLDFE